MSKTVILTGASKGIGRAAADALIDAGYRLALVARDVDPLLQLREKFGEARVRLIAADITSPNAGQIIATETLSHFETIDILINNAGIGIYGQSADANPNDVERVMAVNFFAPLNLMQAVIPAMKSNGGGLIINVSSIIGKRSTPLSGGYCASKAALEKLVESMRIELAADNIRFSTLYPGVTQTHFVTNSLGEAQQLRGRVKGVAPEKVAAKLVSLTKKEPRDAYVTLFDRLYVTGGQFAPRFFDFLFKRYFGF